MKCAVVLADGIKQIMLSPENESEKMALKYITADDEITVDIKRGTMYDRVPSSAEGYVVLESSGHYLRAYEQESALMLVLRPRKPHVNE